MGNKNTNGLEEPAAFVSEIEVDSWLYGCGSYLEGLLF